MFKISEKGSGSHDIFAIGLSTPWEYCESYTKYNNLRFSLFGYYVYIRIPEFIKPKVKKVEYNRNGEQITYNNFIRRHYAFSINVDSFCVYYGQQPDQWVADKPEESDKSWYWHYPWKQWYQISHKVFYGDNQVIEENTKGAIPRLDAWRDFREKLDKIPKYRFTFNDYDGEEIQVEAYIEERIYRINSGGKKNFWWFLPLFIKDNKVRSLDLDFKPGYGKRKSSWKGGTCGHSIELLPNETPQDAFIRYGTEKDSRDGNREFSNIKYLGEY